MKHFILTALLALLTANAAQAERRVETVRDTLNNQTRLIELEDRVVNGQTVTDTLSITTYEGTDADGVNLTAGHETAWNDDDNDYFMGVNTDFVGGVTLISIMGIIFGCGLPMVIIFIIFYYRNKNRKAKYRLAEQILASGQQLPPNFFNDLGVKDLRTRGISNAFLGLGLFIFLWALSDEFSMACIGLLILCIGLGQIVTYYTRERKDKDDTTTRQPAEQ